MDYDGWYGRDNVFRNMVDVQFVAAMGPPGGGRTFISNRYTRHFNNLGLANVSVTCTATYIDSAAPCIDIYSTSLSLEQVSDDTLGSIFRSILDWHLRNYPPALRQSCPTIIAATLEIYSQAMVKLLPTPTKSHYTFNLRDFARVIQV